MAVIYLRHPVHGQKVACGDLEAQMDRANGWEDFDPTVPEPVEPVVEIPAFLSAAPAEQPKAKRLKP